MRIDWDDDDSVHQASPQRGDPARAALRPDHGGVAFVDSGRAKLAPQSVGHLGDVGIAIGPAAIAVVENDEFGVERCGAIQIFEQLAWQRVPFRMVIGDTNRVPRCDRLPDGRGSESGPRCCDRFGCMYIRAAAAVLLLLAFSSMVAFQAPPNHLTDPFAMGWMVVDTNGDGIADFVAGKIVVPAQPTAVENSAAADIAARVGFATTGLTPPVVISAAEDHADGPRIYIGGSAAPAQFRTEIEGIWNSLEAKEGGVFEFGGNLVALGKDNDGLLAAAEQFASRAPYVARIGGDRFSTLGSITGVTYLKGFAGVHRTFLGPAGEDTACRRTDRGSRHARQRA